MDDARFCLRCGTALEEVTLEGRARKRCPACGFVHYGNPLPVVAAIVEHVEGEDETESRIVLVRQKAWPEGWFGLVTGFLERGETPEDAVLRELEEELGLRGDIVSLVGVYPFLQRNEVIATWHVRARGAITLGEELEAYKRIPIPKLRPWPFGTGLAVKDWLAKRG
ncbi:NUDIX domain-containing protein [Sandaracinus amylolyticus]|uniref:NUDIX domain-containing protein n=1 Tax=Sandaracinus amylolyticus TaxID=927083 RepID=UPI001F40182D|nr:NUDIX domain-containing protein [Sandaracinus amylolyticus]UJR78227.1 ADP-ribose pyrophosphatase NudF [Sandaracinus amylolyticus]